MPFGALERPALGLSLLKPSIEDLGARCDVRYLSFAFADLIGAEEYLWIGSTLPYIAFAGDWTFAEALYGPRPEEDERYVDEVLRTLWRLNQPSIDRILRARALVPQFLEYCLATIRWQDYAIVGFSSTFEQNLASLALAREIKRAHPRIQIVFGGANWEGEMGLELHRQFEFVDFVCSGEADQSFPKLVDGLLNPPEGQMAPKLPPGVIYRESGVTQSTGQSLPIRNLDALPIPDFSEYFQAWTESSAALIMPPTVLVETSRGCWWGDKSHCTFCGLNGASMTYRSKTTPRALREFRWLADRWQTDRIEVVDNILDMRYFKDFFPALAEEERSWEIFYEVKANLTKGQLAQLRAAGVTRIQPGIESLSDHILKLMRKGTTALRNVQLLKWCKEYGIGVDWNVLYGFPGETEEDYSTMLELLKAIDFLQPPVACGPIRLDRFSPYFSSPGTFQLSNLRPMAPYRYLYPFEPASLMKIAYHFDFDYPSGVNPRQYAANVIECVENWRNHPEPGLLSSVPRSDGGLLLRDTRNRSIQEVVLSGAEQAAYLYCDETRSLESVRQQLQHDFPDRSTDGLEAFLNSLVANRFMVTDGRNYLSLAIRTRPVDPGWNPLLESNRLLGVGDWTLAPAAAAQGCSA